MYLAAGVVLLPDYGFDISVFDLHSWKYLLCLCPTVTFEQKTYPGYVDLAS